MPSIEVIDSHTGGEPTRLVVAGGPDLGVGPLVERAARLEREHSDFLTTIVAEPRGSQALVAGLLCPPEDSANATGVIFFDNAGLLGMCGHGSIGTMVTLHFMNRINIGSHTLETPVGLVSAELLSPHRARIQNVLSFRWRKDVTVSVGQWGAITGDVVWGGNWFFLVNDPQLEIHSVRIDELLLFTKQIRNQLKQSGITGERGAPIEHIELVNLSNSSPAQSRNFVLCPGGSYDRSPCGTGTSAHLACLAADGRLQPGEIWRQVSVIGSVFDASYTWHDDKIIPYIDGEAYVTGRGELLTEHDDPFRFGIRPA